LPRKLIHRIFFIFIVLTNLQNAFAVIAVTGTNQISEIPIEFDGEHILVAVRINNKGPFQMLLDTGADVCLIKLSLAQELGLQVEAKDIPLGGIGAGKTNARWTKVQNLEIGKVSAKELKLLATEITPKIKKEPVAGIIGFDFFKDRFFQIDYTAQKLRFYSSAPFKKSDPQTEQRAILELSFHGRRRIPVIDIVVNDKQINAGIDTGSDSVLILFPDTTRLLNLEAQVSKLKPVVSFGYGGLTLTRKGEVRKFAMEKISLEKVATEFAVQAWDKEAAQIGNGMLKNFLVTFDYKNRLVVFEKNSARH
jgi:predicted aspartyl protease